MVRICVDNTVSDLPFDASKNLGEVLDAVTKTLPSDRVVTSISLDGKHISRAEKSLIINDPVKNIDELNIRTSNKAVWTANGVDIALSSIERIQKSLIVAAENFREEKIAEANHFFAHCMEGLERFTETMIITRCVLKLDYGSIKLEEGMNLAQIEDQLTSILGNIMECQEKNDPIGIADRIEYELITNLCSWQRGLKLINQSLTSNA